jgi:hypothetical protein
MHSRMLFMSKDLSNSLEYLKKHKQDFLNIYLLGAQVVEPKIALFTAGMSGAGKSEYAQQRAASDTYRHR